MMRRLGLVIRGHDGLNTDDKQPRRIILDPSCRFRSSRPPSPSTCPGLNPYRHTQGRARGPRWLEPVPQNPGSTNRIAGRAVCGRCRLGVPLPANCRLVWARSAEQGVSATAGESRALEAPCLERDEGDDGHEAKRRRRCCSRARRRLVGECPLSPLPRPAGVMVKISRVISCVPGFFTLASERDLWLRSGWDPQERLQWTADGMLRDGWDEVTISSRQRCLFSTALPGPSLVFRDLSTLSEEVVLASFSQTGR